MTLAKVTRIGKLNKEIQQQIIAEVEKILIAGYGQVLITIADNQVRFIEPTPKIRIVDNR